MKAVSDVDTVIRGRAYLLPLEERDNVNTDTIIPPEHLTRFDKAYLGRHAMDGLRGLEPGDFASAVTESGLSILVAGENFGCGSMRAHAVYALGGAGVRAVIATSYARTFYRNAVNLVAFGAELPEPERATTRVLADDSIDDGTPRLGEPYETVWVKSYVSEVLGVDDLTPPIPDAYYISDTGAWADSLEAMI